jgi:hypothetical protein
MSTSDSFVVVVVVVVEKVNTMNFAVPHLYYSMYVCVCKVQLVHFLQITDESLSINITSRQENLKS